MTRRNHFLFIVASALMVVLSGCASTPSPAPVVDRAPSSVSKPTTVFRASGVPKNITKGADVSSAGTYTVKKGDTLQSIALDHGLDYKELAALNNLDNVNVIQVGQELRLPSQQNNNVVTAPLESVPSVTAKPLGGVPEARPLNRLEQGQANPTQNGKPAVNADMLKNQPKANRIPYSDEAFAQLQGGTKSVKVEVAPSSIKQDKPSAISNEEINWGWPIAGKATIDNDGNTSKGIDIPGKPGQPVLASAAGKVIYAGSSLRGYGKLIILQHNKTYLSIYAHNNALLVKEGQAVIKGQKIAEMGSSDADQTKLHFEIRRLGKPVDPLKYLPSDS